MADAQLFQDSSKSKILLLALSATNLEFAAHSLNVNDARAYQQTAVRLAIEESKK